ncbi:hypothetical protein [Nitrosospira sp. Is2]|uniref:hypothetical protein n=1 Tax=Nitrosospira sp. Is2 TaxID=3080532 RepID=UPI0029547CA0|nr:hypothetical protein [Nitrosospira sp. Is2]WON75082.1 hypothetical protein R5L00_06265 [Nitrosospira sp. Is2]
MSTPIDSESSCGVSTNDRIVLLGAANGAILEDLAAITAGSTFLYDKERELQNVLLEAFVEMVFVVRQFQSAHDYIVANGTPELPSYLSQINNSPRGIPNGVVVELHAIDLSTFFKSFLLLSKAVLDKLAPLYSYRFYEHIPQFSDKGTRLIRSIKNSGRVTRKVEMIALIQNAKAQWIDDLISLRDEYAHYSSLKEYRNFWLTTERIGMGPIKGISDFHRPSIEIAGQPRDALGYIIQIKSELISFLNEFLRLCEFTPERRPKHYLNCECGYAFAKRQSNGPRKGRLELTANHLELRLKNRTLDYAVIICPKCGATTDTDLKFWRDEGFNFEGSIVPFASITM